jgi:hypothetical protein
MLMHMKTTGQGFANLLNAHMRSEGLTIGKLAELTGKSYEHMRKLVAGEALPSPLLVEKLAAVTGLPVAHAQQAADRDRIQKQYGAALLSEIAHTTDRVSHFAPLINALNDEQAEVVLAMLKGLVEGGRPQRKTPNQLEQEKTGRKLRVSKH